MKRKGVQHEDDGTFYSERKGEAPIAKKASPRAHCVADFNGCYGAFQFNDWASFFFI